MECNDTDGNPWASFAVETRSPKRCSSKIIDNRFPNNFKKSSSIVTCDLCQVLLLKSQTLHHFKALHNKKLTKKYSKFTIPYNAIEVCDLICEHRSQKLLLAKKSTNNNKNSNLFQLKRKKCDIGNVKESNKILSKLSKPTSILIDMNISNGIIKNEKEVKIENSIEKRSCKNNDKIVQINSVKNININESHLPNEEVMKSENLINQSLNSKIESDCGPKENDLKLNIKVNSNGLLTSSMKTESNIFDRISSLCSNSLNSKPNGYITTPCKGTIKQTGFDNSYGCKIFTDEHNNSILIDNDKDEQEDFDCCGSSVSNDSAYYSLPNTNNGNSLSTPCIRKSTNFYDSNIVPPLVTAYQFSNSNTISYNTSNSDPQKRHRPTSATMVVTRNSSRNSILSTKSNVKHRFYVSGHSNQNILNSIRKHPNINSNNTDGVLKENAGYNSDNHPSGLLHIPSENKEYFNLENSSSFGINNQHGNLSSTDCRDIINNSVNTCDNRFIRQSVLNYNYWKCIQENGFKYSLLIPKRLCWSYKKSRCNAMPHLYTKKLKYSSEGVVHQPQFNTVTSHSSISDNPLLSSYTIESSGNDGFLQTDLIGSQSIILDYPFPDRNQMSFQQRLLERGVISQRDIARSQRCLSLNNHTLIRKNVKSNSNKQVFMDSKKMFTNKTCSFKNQIISHIGNEIGGSQCIVNKSNYAYNDSVMKDNQNRSAILLDNNFDLMSNSVLNHQRHSWHDNVQLPKIPNVNSNISTFQGLCLSQNNKPNKSNGTVVIGSNSNFNSVFSHLDNNNTETIIPNYTFQSDSSLLQLNNNSMHSGASAQTILSNDSLLLSQPLGRKYISHSMQNGINRYNGCTQNFANHSANIIHTHFDR